MVNNSTNINKIYTTTSKQWWSTISLISTKQTTTSKQLCSTIPPISIKQTTTSKQWRSTILPISIKQPPLNSDGQQFHQYQQSKQPPLNSYGQQFHQYQQNKQPTVILTELTEHKKFKIQHCSKAKLVNGNSNPTRLIAGSPMARFFYYLSHKTYSKVLILHDLTETKQ